MKPISVIMLLAIAATLGACKDVPIDDGSSHIITRPKDTTHIPTPRDSCPDCTPADRPSQVSMLWIDSAFAYYDDNPNKGDVDSIMKADLEIDLSNALSRLKFEPGKNGKETLSFEFTTRLSWPKPATPGSISLFRALHVKIARIEIQNGKGECEIGDNPDHPFDDDKNGAALYVPFNDSSSFSYPTNRSHSDISRLVVTKIDREKRMIDGFMDLKFYFPGSGIPIFNKPDKMKALAIKHAIIRLGY
jgi:hypothetical protein